MIIGIRTWRYTVALPRFAGSGIFSADVVRQGLFGLSWLRPQALLGLNLPPLAHGVLWSLSLNILSYVAFSLGRESASIERVQSSFFVPSDLAPAAPSFRLWRSSVTV